MSGQCVWTGGVLFPGGVSGSDGGGSDAHSAGFGRSRTGEVSAVQRHLQCYEEGEGENCFYYLEQPFRSSMSTKQALQSYRWKRCNAWSKQ